MTQSDVHLSIDPTYSEDYPTVYRCMAFADIAGFTAYTHRYGNHAGARMLEQYRATIRSITGRHGIRVAKWLGDGVMLVGTTDQPVIETLLELMNTCDDHGFPVHCGAAGGDVIIFEGDDYIGRSVNLSARLCDQARAGHLLAININFTSHTTGFKEYATLDLEIKGIGKVQSISHLSPKHYTAKPVR